MVSAKRLIQFRPPDALAARLDRYVRSERPPSANKAVIALVESALDQWEKCGPLFTAERIARAVDSAANLLRTGHHACDSSSCPWPRLTEDDINELITTTIQHLSAAETSGQ